MYSVTLSRSEIGYCIILCILIGTVAQEPSCYTTNRFEYEFSVLQKLDSLEKETSLLHKKHTDLIEQMAILLAENKGTLYYVSVFNKTLVLCFCCVGVNKTKGVGAISL